MFKENLRSKKSKVVYIPLSTYTFMTGCQTDHPIHIYLYKKNIEDFGKISSINGGVMKLNKW